MNNTAREEYGKASDESVWGARLAPRLSSMTISLRDKLKLSLISHAYNERPEVYHNNQRERRYRQLKETKGGEMGSKTS